MNKRAILSLAILSIALLQKTVSGISDSNLAGYWKFDETKGTTAVDSSGNKNDGKLINGADWTPASGKFRGAVSFGASNNKSSVEIPTAGINPATGAIALWIHPAEPQSTNRRKGCRYIFGCGDRGSKIQLYMNDNNTQLDAELGYEFHNIQNVATLSTNNWHHIVLTWNKGAYAVYVDGTEKVTGNHYRLTRPPQAGYLGNEGADSDKAFHGFIDEAAIFNCSLKEDDVLRLYNNGVDFLAAQPELRAFAYTIQEGNAILEQKDYQKATVFFEKAKTELERWRKENPQENGSYSKELLSELYFQLAESRKASGFSKQDIAAAYKSAAESSLLSISKQGTALLWLYKNMDIEEYRNFVVTIIKKDGVYLTAASEEAEIMMGEKKAKETILFLEDNLSTHTYWQQKNLSDYTVPENELCGMYFQLAKAKEAAGMPKKDIVDAYMKAWSFRNAKCVSAKTAALIWMLDNDCKDEYTGIIKPFADNDDTKDSFHNIVADVCTYFETKKNWTGYERLLNVLFTEAKYPAGWALFVESGFGNKTGPWTKQYFDYLESKPTIKLRRDHTVAERYLSNREYQKAADLYADIMNRCENKYEKKVFEFKLCRCLFELGQYNKITSRLESLIATSKATHRNLVKKAILINGRAYFRLKELEKAIDCFLTFIIEFPETREVQEANFFLGYCYMLKGDFDTAREAFDYLVKVYPESSYVDKARLYLSRIKDNIKEVDIPPKQLSP